MATVGATHASPLRREGSSSTGRKGLADCNAGYVNAGARRRSRVRRGEKSFALPTICLYDFSYRSWCEIRGASRRPGNSHPGTGGSQEDCEGSHVDCGERSQGGCEGRSQEDCDRRGRAPLESRSEIKDISAWGRAKDFSPLHSDLAGDAPFVEGDRFPNRLDRDQTLILPSNLNGLPPGVQQFQRVGDENPRAPEDQSSTTDAGVRGKVPADLNARHESLQSRGR